MLKKILMIGAMVAMSGSVFAAFDNTTSTANSGAASQAGAAAQSGSQTYIDQSGNVSTVQAPDIPVASSASVFVQSCQYGAAGQGQSAGISMGSDSAQCMNLRQAAIHMEQYERYVGLAQKTLAGSEGQAALYKSANRELGLFQKYLDRSSEAADYAHPTKVVGGAVTDVLPIGILIGIFTLI
jgi:hypothetical protein